MTARPRPPRRNRINTQHRHWSPCCPCAKPALRRACLGPTRTGPWLTLGQRCRRIPAHNLFARPPPPPPPTYPSTWRFTTTAPTLLSACALRCARADARTRTHHEGFLAALALAARVDERLLSLEHAPRGGAALQRLAQQLCRDTPATRAVATAVRTARPPPTALRQPHRCCAVAHGGGPLPHRLLWSR